MADDTKQHIKPLKPKGLPAEMRLRIKGARKERGWSQSDLTERVGLTQRHISDIESGKIVPRYDTALELVRTLDFDLVMIPRSLVPVVQALIRDHLHAQSGEDDERPLYGDLVDEDAKPELRDEV